MKVSLAGKGSLVSAVAAVVGSVALSLQILHPRSDGLLPWSAPAGGGHVAAVILPAAHAARQTAPTQIERPFLAPTRVSLTPTHKTTRPATHPVVPKHHTPSPPPTPAPTPAPTPQPVTTPVTTPPVSAPAVTTSNGRWSAAPKIKSWKGAAAKQATRVVKGKPPWADPKNALPAATPPSLTAPVQAAPAASKTPPGQAKKTTPPPGQIKKAR